jgi:hypothetical protein
MLNITWSHIFVLQGSWFCNTFLYFQFWGIQRQNPKCCDLCLIAHSVTPLNTTRGMSTEREETETIWWRKWYIKREQFGSVRSTSGFVRGLTIKFANSPPCACRGSSGQKPQYGLMLLLIYGNFFLSGVYYCLSVFWCAIASISELELEHCLWGGLASKQITVLEHPPYSSV